MWVKRRRNEDPWEETALFANVGAAFLAGATTEKLAYGALNSFHSSNYFGISPVDHAIHAPLNPVPHVEVEWLNLAYPGFCSASEDAQSVATAGSLQSLKVGMGGENDGIRRAIGKS